MKGFFNIEKPKKQESPGTGGQSCESCGLYRAVNSPKMMPSGEGKKRILILAQNAGQTEDDEGTQLIGVAGQTLRKKFRSLRVNIDRDCWKDNSIRCKTPKNREPSNKEISCCRPKILRTIKQLKPEKIFVFGKPALCSLFGNRMTNIGGISKWVGNKIPDQELGCWVFPMYHPQYLNYNKDNVVLEKMFENHLKAAVEWDIPFPDNSNIKEHIKILKNEYDVIKALETILESQTNPIVIDFEATGLKPHKQGHKIICIGIALSEYCAIVFQPKSQKVLGLLKQIFASNKIKKAAQNIKFEDTWGKVIFGFPIKNWVWDTMLASHVLDNRSGITSLDFQAFVRYGIFAHSKEMKKHVQTGKKSANAFNKLKDMPQEQLFLECGLHTLLEYRLMEDQRREMGSEAKGYMLLHNGTLALSDVENSGICVDTDYYEKQKNHIKRRIKLIDNQLLKSDAARLYQNELGKEINFNSPSQLSTLLFDLMGIKPLKETKTGQSTDEKVLKQLTDKAPFLTKILQKKKLKKVGDKIEDFLRETVEGRMHPHFDLHIPRTYRSSSSNPNFQNIHKRDKEAQKIARMGIKPSPGNLLLSLDFKGVEIGTSCFYHKDPKMIESVSDPIKDMHRDLAMQLFLLDKEQMTFDIRHSGKNEFVFPEFYGDWFGSCAVELWKSAKMKKTADGVLLIDHLERKGIKNYNRFEKHVEEAEYDFWHNKFKVFTKWKDCIWKEYQKNGYITLLSGFKCSDLIDRKQVINSPIQGTAFHILLWSLIELNRIRKLQEWRSRIIGQIHDDVILDVCPVELDRITREFNQIIHHKIREHWPWINVPLEVEAKVSVVDGNWYEMKGIKI